jgi:hypothetical protein
VREVLKREKPVKSGRSIRLIKVGWSRLITAMPGKVTKTFPELEIRSPQT